MTTEPSQELVPDQPMANQSKKCSTSAAENSTTSSKLEHVETFQMELADFLSQLAQIPGTDFSSLDVQLAKLRESHLSLVQHLSIGQATSTSKCTDIPSSTQHMDISSSTQPMDMSSPTNKDLLTHYVSSSTHPDISSNTYLSCKRSSFTNEDSISNTYLDRTFGKDSESSMKEIINELAHSKHHSEFECSNENYEMHSYMDQGSTENPRRVGLTMQMGCFYEVTYISVRRALARFGELEYVIWDWGREINIAMFKDAEGAARAVNKVLTIGECKIHCDWIKSDVFNFENPISHQILLKSNKLPRSWDRCIKVRKHFLKFGDVTAVEFLNGWTAVVSFSDLSVAKKMIGSYQKTILVEEVSRHTLPLKKCRIGSSYLMN